MSRIPRLIIEIPANAKPRDFDLKSLTAPVGQKAPAHLRARFQVAPVSSSPSIPLSPVAPAPSPAVQAAPEAFDPVLSAAAVAAPVIPAVEAAAPVVAPVQEPPVVNEVKPIDENMQLVAEEPAAPDLYESEYIEEHDDAPAPTDEELLVSAVAVTPAFQEAVASGEALTLDDSVDTAVETKRIAEDVSRFVDKEEELSAATPYMPLDDEEEVGSLSGGVLAGFGTLAMAIVTLLLLSTGVFFLWDHYSKDNTELDVAKNDGPVLPINFQEAKNKGNPDAKGETGKSDGTDKGKKGPVKDFGTSTSKKEPVKVPEPKKEPVKEPDPKKDAVGKEPATKPDEKTALAGKPTLEPFVGIEEDSADGDSLGFGFSSSVGVEEEEPGLIQRIEDLRAKAIAAEAKQQWVEALDLYAQILNLKAGDLNALFRSGTIHYKTGSYAEAESFYKETLKLDAGMSKARNNYGLVKLAQGQRGEARKAFEIASKQANPDALVNLGNELAREGKNLTAVNYYRQALEIRPDHNIAKISMAVSLMTIDKEKAKELLLTLKDKEAVAPRAQMLLGKLAHDEKCYEEAIQYYKAAIDGDPKLLDARMNYAMALIRNNQAQEALAQMRLVVAERPKDALAWMNIGIVFMAVGDREKAKKCYEYSITLNKYIAETHFNYARCAEVFGNTLIAVEEYELALKLNKFYWQAAFNIGLIYLKDKRPEKALSYFNQTISIRANFAPSHLNRAKALLQLKKVDEAKSALRTYLLLSPKDDPDREAIESALRTMDAAGSRRGF